MSHIKVCTHKHISQIIVLFSEVATRREHQHSHHCNRGKDAVQTPYFAAPSWLSPPPLCCSTHPHSPSAPSPPRCWTPHKPSRRPGPGSCPPRSRPPGTRSAGSPRRVPASPTAHATQFESSNWRTTRRVLACGCPSLWWWLLFGKPSGVVWNHKGYSCW